MGRHRYEELDIWKLALDLSIQVSFETRTYPNVEKYALVTQTNRSAYSIPSNIAEGAGRGGNKEFVNFLHYALGSLNELETQILIAFKLDYLQEERYQYFIEKYGVLKKMIINLTKALV